MKINKRQILETAIAAIVGIALLGSGFWLGWTEGVQYPKTITVTQATSMTPPPGSSATSADFSVFWEAWQDVNDLYLRNPGVSSTAKVYGAVNGLIQSLGDPYTEFFSPADNQQFQQTISGNFGGIGAELGTDAKNEIAIVAPLAGTPAEAVGLKAQDVIVAINGSSTDTMTVDQAVNIIRGPIGTKVTLTIMRTGWSKTQDFTITRANIEVPIVKFEMKGNIAHISLEEFDQTADQLFYEALVKAVNNNAKGIVLDLRDDPGGYLNVAVDLAGYFLKPGTLVVSEVGRSVGTTTYMASGEGALDTFPMVVLVNGGSASASEILAGALHDDRGIKLIGEKTFGKGTVQELENLSDGSSLKITVAHWVLPSGLIIDHQGIQPDYAVSSTATGTAKDQDPQLSKALQVLQSEMTQ
ncbi:MAG: S41 family peptidase [Minisyncoccia bacterium]